MYTPSHSAPKVLHSKKKQNNAFTLIELLVVIAIIGILASVVLANLNTARAKARDAQRKSNAYQIQNALRMYFLDNNSFPVCGNIENSWNDVVRSTDSNWEGCLSTALSPYLPKLPIDPINKFTDKPYYYYYACELTSASDTVCDTITYINVYYEKAVPDILALTIRP